MPTLSQMLAANPTGFVPDTEKSLPPPPPQPGQALGGNAAIRCPLPPFNAQVDTMRQFNESGATPTMRVIPLPAATSSGSGNVITNVTATASGGSGGGGTATSLTPSSVVISAPSLSPAQTFLTSAQMSRSFQLLQLSATGRVEVRIYSTASAQASDRLRPSDSAPPFEVMPGLITDVVFDTAPYQWAWQNRIAANADDPTTPTIYITVGNPSPSQGVSATTVTISFLPLEI